MNTVLVADIPTQISSPFCYSLIINTRIRTKEKSYDKFVFFWKKNGKPKEVTKVR